MEVTAPHRARAAEQPPKRRTRPPGARSFRISDSAWLLGLGFVRLTRVTRGLLRGVRGRPGIDADGALGYVVAVARHRLGKARRRDARARRRYGPLELALAVESPVGADREADYHELTRALRASLATLPPERRDLLLEPLRAEHAPTPATQSHVHPATIRTWRKRARARLRVALASLR